MDAMRRRTRMVNFRVSEDEFQNLREVQDKSGARSVSDYARSAVFASANAPGDDKGLSVQVASINERLNALGITLSQIHLMVRDSAPPKAVVATTATH